MMFDGMGTSAAQIRAGSACRARRGDAQRTPEFPDIPTAAEIGVPNWIVSTWYGLWAIKGTPQPIVDRMHAEIVKALANPKLQAIWKDQTAQVGGESQAEFAKRIRAEIEKWQKVVDRGRSEARLSYARTNPAPHHQGRRPFRRRLARALFDRRLDLPGRAGGRRAAARRDRPRAGRSTWRATPRPRSCRAAPAPRSAARRWARRWSSTSRSTCARSWASTRTAPRSRCSPASCSTSSTPG